MLDDDSAFHGYHGEQHFPSQLILKKNNVLRDVSGQSAISFHTHHGESRDVPLEDTFEPVSRGELKKIRFNKATKCFGRIFLIDNSHKGLPDNKLKVEYDVHGYITSKVYFDIETEEVHRYSKKHKPAFITCIKGRILEEWYFEQGVWSRKDGAAIVKYDRPNCRLRVIKAWPKKDMFYASSGVMPIFKGPIKEEIFYVDGRQFRGVDEAGQPQPTHVKYFISEGEQVGVSFESFKGSEGALRARKFKYTFEKVWSWQRQEAQVKKRVPLTSEVIVTDENPDAFW